MINLLKRKIVYAFLDYDYNLKSQIFSEFLNNIRELESNQLFALEIKQKCNKTNFLRLFVLVLGDYVNILQADSVSILIRPRLTLQRNPKYLCNLSFEVLFIGRFYLCSAGNCFSQLINNPINSNIYDKIKIIMLWMKQEKMMYRINWIKDPRLLECVFCQMDLISNSQNNNS